MSLNFVVIFRISMILISKNILTLNFQSCKKLGHRARQYMNMCIHFYFYSINVFKYIWTNDVRLYKSYAVWHKPRRDINMDNIKTYSKYYITDIYYRV